MSSRGFEVLIAGGGVAGLEAVLALGDLAGERVHITLLTPEDEFRYRPLGVREPFGERAADHHRVADIATELGVTLVADAFAWLDPDQRAVHTQAGAQLGYDALLLALGARPQPRLAHAITLDIRHLDAQLHGLIQDVEAGYVSSVGFVVPDRQAWPLPIYELALMTARRAWEMCEQVAITVLTPEDAPLAVFGEAASAEVERVLDAHRVSVIAGVHCETPRRGELSLHPGGRTLRVDRVVALPELVGPSTPGVPKSQRSGFVSVDEHCRVTGLERVWAAGDMTNYPIKFGGIAAQQADTAAQAIAALAGAPVRPQRLDPQLRAILFGGERPLYLSAHATGVHGSHSVVGHEPAWAPAGKITARYLTPYLAERGGVPSARA